MGILRSSVSAAAVWHVGGGNAADANPGTAERPVQSVSKAVSLAKPGDTVIVSRRNLPLLPGRDVPAGRPDLPIILRSDGKGKVTFTNDGSGHILLPGSYNTVDGIEFQMTSESPRGNGIDLARKEHVTIRNCRFFACQIAVERVEHALPPHQQ